jgi:hypothetical protein
MHISFSEWREREKQVEQVIYDVETVLKNAGVQKVLGANAFALYGISQTIFLPNIKNGMLSMPKEYQDTDLVPMVTLKQDEELKADQSLATMCMTQSRIMEERLQKWREDPLGDTYADPAVSVQELDEELMQGNIKSGGTPVGIKGANGRMVRAQAAARRLKDGRSFQILQGRPMVVLDMNEHYVEYEAAAITLHEFEHIRQFLESPLLPTITRHLEVRRLEQELRAYRVEAEVGWAMDIPSVRMIGSKALTTCIADAYLVEDYRRRAVRFGDEYRHFDKEDEKVLLTLTGAGLPAEHDIETS